jgi:hypothetical protein
VQKAFNAILPEDLSTKLSDLFPIGAPDSSISSDLVAAGGVLSPTNHRLRALSHDPILGIIFGIKDMLNGTCTVVQNGQIVVYPSSKGVTDETNIFRLIARMFGHLASDVNAPQQKETVAWVYRLLLWGYFVCLRGSLWGVLTSANK